MFCSSCFNVTPRLANITLTTCARDFITPLEPSALSDPSQSPLTAQLLQRGKRLPWFPLEGAEGVDALTAPQRRMCVSPSSPAGGRTAQNVNVQELLISVIPFWPRRPRFSALINLSIQKPCTLLTGLIHLSRSIAPSRFSLTPLEKLSVERAPKLHLPHTTKVISTMLTLHCCSIIKIYELSWRTFIRWY